MDWVKEAERLRFDRGLSWTATANGVRHLLPGMTDQQRMEKVRRKLRRSERYESAERPDATEKAEPAGEVTDEQLLKALETKRAPQSTAEILHMPVTDFVRRVDGLADRFNICESNGLIWLEKTPLAGERETREKYRGAEEITFGLVSDTHLCSKHQQLTHLNDFYDRCASAGVTTVYHVGDISDGFYQNRPDHIYDLFRLGADEQAEYIIEKYPRRPGITTKFITGNHDVSHMKNGGTDIGKRIGSARDDMEYLGYMSAKVWLTPHCDLDLLHPLDGTSYAQSYSVQKHIDALQGGQKPRIFAFGHYHKNFYMHYRNIHAIAVPCFESQTRFMKGKRLSATVGGYIITVRCTPEGIVREIVPRVVVYADMVDSDY